MVSYRDGFTSYVLTCLLAGISIESISEQPNGKGGKKRRLSASTVAEMSSAFVKMKKPMLAVPCIVHNESSQQQNQQSNDVNCGFLLFFLCLDSAQEAKTVYIPINAAPQPPLLPLLPQKKHSSKLSLTKAVERFISVLPIGKQEELLSQCVEERDGLFSLACGSNGVPGPLVLPIPRLHPIQNIEIRARAAIEKWNFTKYESQLNMIRREYTPGSTPKQEDERERECFLL